VEGAADRLVSVNRFE